MKKNSSKKNLFLHKQTIAHLNGREMRKILGGSDSELLYPKTSNPIPTCDPCLSLRVTLDTDPSDP